MNESEEWEDVDEIEIHEWGSLTPIKSYVPNYQLHNAVVNTPNIDELEAMVKKLELELQMLQARVAELDPHIIQEQI